VSELLWVAVPDSAPSADGQLVLRALVVPRLNGAEPSVLMSYGMEDWPAVLAAATLTVETAAAPGATAEPVDAVRVDHVQAGVWPRFFAPTMPVRPWVSPDQRAPGSVPRAVDVEPTSLRAGNIARNYTAAAQAIAAPSAGGDPDDIVREQYQEWAGVGPAPEVVPGSPSAWELPDFHRCVALLREHPSVLRALGLIVELRLTGALPLSTSAAPRAVRVRCTPVSQELPPPDMASVWTAYEFDGGRFRPSAPPGSDLVDGMVSLAGAGAVLPSPPPGEAPPPPPPRWAVATFDVDGGVGRLREAAGAGGSTAEGAGRASLPALRSTGLMLVRGDRAASFKARVDAGADHATQSTADLRLTADDLVLGYRIDVRELGGDWAALCHRTATYTVDGELIGAAGREEEGHVKAHAAAAVGSGESWRADEVVARWNGWSLAVRQPLFDQSGVRPVPEGRLPMPFEFRWDFGLASNRMLPRLRFGASYHLRARVADIAGGGLGLTDDAGSEHETDLVTYRRHEPVPPPEIPFDDGQQAPPLGPGGAIDQLVIRSDPAIALTVAQFAEQQPQYPANDVRALLPPPASIALVEQHGLLDGIDDRTTWTWAKRALSAPVATSGGDYSWLPDPAAFGVVVRVRPEPGSPAPGATEEEGWGPGWPDFAAKALHLVANTTGSSTIRWDDEGRRAIVSLRPAEQVTLELSSHLNSNNVAQLEIRQWLGDASDATVIAGRHPMVTPARAVRLVHAVRKPLNEPSGTLEARRAEGQTFAVIEPSDALAGIDVASTAQVDVAASWKESSDSAEPTDVAEEVMSLRIDPGAEALPPVRHEFGDTRHRRVTYTLTAISRFTQYFDAGTPEDFRRQKSLGEVSVPSSARPGPPRVLSVTPSFRWEGLDVAAGWTSLERVRRGGRLRVELARPWFTTGPGEMLAVVSWPVDSEEEMPEAVASIVSSAHRDPIWGTPFSLRTARSPECTGTTGPPGTARLAESGHPVTVYPYAVSLTGDRWCADVEIPSAAETSYCPFMRLGVARYQPDSVPGLELSGVVRTELVQLFPDRTLTLERTAEGLRVHLAGLGPEFLRPNRVIASVERCTVADGTTADAVELMTRAAGATAGLWRPEPGLEVAGDLNATLALTVPSGEGARRVVVREIERIPAERKAPVGSIGAELEQRTVFADVIPLLTP
jgi:hypothetical protein